MRTKKPIDSNEAIREIAIQDNEAILAVYDRLDSSKLKVFDVVADRNQFCSIVEGDGQFVSLERMAQRWQARVERLFSLINKTIELKETAGPHGFVVDRPSTAPLETFSVMASIIDVKNTVQNFNCSVLLNGKTLVPQISLNSFEEPTSNNLYFL